MILQRRLLQPLNKLRSRLSLQYRYLQACALLLSQYQDSRGRKGGGRYVVLSSIVQQSKIRSQFVSFLCETGLNQVKTFKNGAIELYVLR